MNAMLITSYHRLPLLLLAFFFTLTLSACDTLTSFVVSDAQEVEIGAEVDHEIRDEFRVLPASDPATKWAEALVASLNDAADDYRDSSRIDDYKVHVIDDNELINAFAAPGGYIYIVSGLILQADDCAEVAGVVGHELAHVTQRHSAKSLAKNAAAFGLTDIFLNEGAIKESTELLYAFVQGTAFSRKDETEADKVGANIVYNSGYHPKGLANMFRTLGNIAPDEEPKDPSKMNRFLEFFSSHPDSARRVKAIENQIEKDWPDVDTDGQHTYDCVNLGNGVMSFSEVQQHLAD